MKVNTRNFDVKGMSVDRLFRQYLGGKLRPLCWFSNGLQFKHILALGIRHYLGYPIAYLTTRYQRQWQVLLRNWRRLKAMLTRNEVKSADRKTSDGAQPD